MKTQKESQLETDLNKEVEKTKITIGFKQARDILTDKRIEILETLAKKEFNTITQLANHLDRDKKNISKDIKKLFETGIIDLKNQGRSKKPEFNFNKIQIKTLQFQENQPQPEKTTAASLENSLNKLYSKEMPQITDEIKACQDTK